MRLHRHSKPASWLWGLASVTALLAVWEIAAHVVNKEIIVPSIEATILRALDFVARPDFFPVLGATLWRMLLTFALDLCLALILGIPAGLDTRVEAFIRPVETAMRAIPTMGVLLAALIWFDSELTPLFVCSLIVFPILYRAIVEGMRSVDKDLEHMVLVFALPLRRQVSGLYLPSILPFVRSGVSAAIGLLIKVMITAEVLAQPALGIGTKFQVARAGYDTAAVLAWSLVVVVLAWLLEKVAQIALREKRNSTRARDQAGGARDSHTA